jgi:hypothetical protein
MSKGSRQSEKMPNYLPLLISHSTSALCDMAWHNKTGQVKVSQVKAMKGKEKQGKERQGRTGKGKARQNRERIGRESQVK